MGQVLGRYHIIDELGRGGMGVVYKALDPKLERFIAIKCLGEDLSEDEIVVARFLREARNVAALNHPNIAQIFVADEHEGKPYFVMEYVDGESLADFIDREGQCSPEMARRVTEQAANALAAAAREGIVHRDVKPGNIMIDRRGRAVLTDFGIACIAAEQAEAGGSGSIMGTPGYLPPEALTGEPVDARGDMFSLGAVYYEMLTGRRLIPAHNLKDTFAQLAGGDFPDLEPLEGNVDERVLEILRTLLALKPEDRYRDWQGLLEAMAPLKTGRTGPVERPDSEPSTAERQVTAAVATGRDETVTPTASTEPAASTAALETASQTDQAPIVVAPTRRRSKGPVLALAALLLVVLAGAGWGLTRVAPGLGERVLAWLPGAEGPEPATAVSADASDSAPAREASGSSAAGSTRAGQALAVEGAMHNGEQSSIAAPEADAMPEGSLSGDEGASSLADAASDSPAVDAGQLGRAGPKAADRVATQDAATPSPVAETGAGLAAESPGIPESATVAEARQPVATAAEPPAQGAPDGVVVIGLGDPVIADPMVRAIESALEPLDRPVIERSFVRGYRGLIDGEEIDLGALAEPAMNAGARYVILARALPAGERELQYYNRIETAFIAQLEAVTYDLYEMRQMGASPVEQIEFTALNATRRAVASVQPWLPGIKAQFQ